MVSELLQDAYPMVIHIPLMLELDEYQKLVSLQQRYCDLYVDYIYDMLPLIADGKDICPTSKYVKMMKREDPERFSALASWSADRVMISASQYIYRHKKKLIRFYETGAPVDEYTKGKLEKFILKNASVKWNFSLQLPFITVCAPSVNMLKKTGTFKIPKFGRVPIDRQYINKLSDCEIIRAYVYAGYRVNNKNKTQPYACVNLYCTKPQPVDEDGFMLLVRRDENCST